eukprot:TRINITY_DN82392_c0_g1_i1.p1 TRINITY_DN82392_c0_g1~~TRINITY_DN82392_c0_g1_i1.p1  ORF type:complete len:194 (+),score=45.46 TRINITY_DN82392_c0_g1_i1:80-583(+)
MAISNILSLTGLNRFICLATGGACGYAFTNPDVDNVYDLFPVQKPPPFAFINVYKIKAGENTEFEESWKNVARMNQKQQGYLFTKLMRANDKTGVPSFDYIDMSQWASGDSFRRASLRPGHQSTVGSLQCTSENKPMMYTRVVDDTIVEDANPMPTMQEQIRSRRQM